MIRAVVMRRTTILREEGDTWLSSTAATALRLSCGHTVVVRYGVKPAVAECAECSVGEGWVAQHARERDREAALAAVEETGR